MQGQGWGSIVETELLGGGIVSNNAQRLTTDERADYYYLTQNDTPRRPICSSAKPTFAGVGGLRWPTRADALSGSHDFLLTEYLAAAQPAGNYWEAFGQRLARLHNHNQPGFGFAHDNYLGTTSQLNAGLDTGHEFSPSGVCCFRENWRANADG
jgi:fructosamine-3-kinase